MLIKKRCTNQKWYLYILECKDASLYTGITTDIKRRFTEHKNGKGAKYTRARGVVQVVYSEFIGSSKGDALKREDVVKKLSRDEKLSLIEKNSCKIL